MENDEIYRSFTSLGADVNKFKGDDPDGLEGVSSDFVSELTLNLSDEELIKLKTKWETDSRGYEAKISKRQQRNEDYYLGKSYGSSLQGDETLSDNELFMAMETFIPEVTRANPDPIVTINNDENDFSKYNKEIILKRADEISIRLKMKKNVRFWGIYLIGCIKFVWDELEDNFDIEVLRPKKMIFDPEAIIEEGVYKGRFLGERRRLSAAKLVKKFPNKAAYIKEKVKGKMGTMVGFIEWWADEYVFWTLDNEVLDKKKNPHFNYDGEAIEITDKFGQVVQDVTEPMNLFKVPQMPYGFLSVFSLDKQPHDETGLLEQNIPNQDRINKMIRQIDKNIDNMNNGIVLSGDAIDKESAARAAKAIRNGGVVWIPTGNVSAAVTRIQSPSLPADVYNNLQIVKQDLSNIFGTTGFTPQGVKNEETIRGKILIKGQDQSRNSAISEAIEQLYDHCYNWFIQMVFVHYELEHLERVLKEEEAQRYLELKPSFFNKLLISIKEGSMVPKDPLTKRNEAVDRYASGAIDPLSYMEALDVPDPKEATRRLLLYQTNPQLYAAEMGIQLPAQPQQPVVGGGGQQVSGGEVIPPEQAAAENPTGTNILSAIPT